MSVCKYCGVYPHTPGLHHKENCPREYIEYESENCFSKYGNPFSDFFANDDLRNAGFLSWYNNLPSQFENPFGPHRFDPSKPGPSGNF
jgi:hypothetical protein